MFPIPLHRVAFLLATAVVLAGCGGDGAASQPSPTAEPRPADILTRASQRLADTGTIHFDLGVEGETFIDDARTMRLLEANGDLARPDSVRTSFKLRIVLATVSIQLITVGDESWSTNILTGAWGPAPEEFGYDPGILFDSQNGIGPVMGRVRDARRADDEELAGRATFHVAGVVDQEVIGPITADTMTGSPVAVDLWIDKQTHDLLRVRLAEPPSEGRAEPATWTLDLSRHGEQVTIEAPV